MYFLKISGEIPPNKQKEFEQTFRLFGEQIPGNCSGYSFSKDLLDNNMYHFFSYWKLLPSLESFRNSNAYFILIGAFKTLGRLSENNTGNMEQSLINSG